MTTYALIDSSGNVNSVILYDGVSEYTPPEGLTLVLATENAVVGGTYSNGVFTAPSIQINETQLLTNFIFSVQAALIESDKTMLRVQEAVSLGITTLTTADVVAWINYRRSLRALLISNNVGVLPTKPTYPQGT